MDVNRKAFELLKISGWHPGRRIDCIGTAEFLKDRGFLLNSVVVAFLEEFGQLEFNVINRFDDTCLDRHHTFAKKAIGSLRPDNFVNMERFLGERIVPVGELYNRHLFLFVSENGNIYSDLGLLGNNFLTAFQNLFDNKIEKSFESLPSKETLQIGANRMCIVTDKSSPEIINVEVNEEKDEKEYEEFRLDFACFNGINGYNTTIRPLRDFSYIQEYKAYYRFSLTDGFIDRCASDYAEMFNGKNIEAIRVELERLRAGVLSVKALAKQNNLRAYDDTYSLEVWPIENCAEIWAVRNAILQGIRFENVAIAVVRSADRGIVCLCNNCKRIFENNYKVTALT